MKFAYADPPYLGCGALYDAPEWNDLETHRQLIQRLELEYPDGWVLSLHTPSLRRLLELCPEGVRTGAWCKSFASFKPNVNPAYCWEPVIFRGGRKYTRADETVRDFLVCPITLERGLAGAKPEAFCFWVLQLLNVQPEDEFYDLFPGTGVMGRVLELWKGSLFVSTMSASTALREDA